MDTLKKIIAKLFDTEKARQERINDYLNESVDIYDLEHRMRNIDRQKWDHI